MSTKKHSLTTYVQRTLMQFLPAMGKKAAIDTDDAKPTTAPKPAQKQATPRKGAPTSGKKKVAATPSKSANGKKAAATKQPVAEDEADDADSDEEPAPKKSHSSTASATKKGSKPTATPQKQKQKAASIPASAKKAPTSHKKQPAKPRVQEPSSDEGEESEGDSPMETASEGSDEEYEHADSDEPSEDEQSEDEADEVASLPNGRSHKQSNGKSKRRSPSRSHTPTRRSVTSRSPSRSRSPSPSSAASSAKARSKKQQSASKKKTPAKRSRSKETVRNDSSTEDENEAVMSDVDSVASSSAASLTSPTSSAKSKPSTKRKHAASVASATESEEEEDEAASRRSATPPLPPTSSLHTSISASPLSHPSDDDAEVEPDRRMPSKVKHIDHVQIGNYELATWYHSPYPDIYRTAKKLFVCQYCLKYCKEYKSLAHHAKECMARKPPGKLIYTDGRHSVFEVDGSAHKLYCQLLCLFAKMFIDHKTLYYDVDPFLFYVLTESDTPEAPSSKASPTSSPSSSPATASVGHQVVAYFSKEKQSPDQFNLSCILAFPQYQRRGYGKFLIALSYELSRREKRIGSPEKPLSELGKVSYRSYWVSELLDLLARDPKHQSLSILDICNLTAIKKEDVISALESVQLIQYVQGEHQLECTSKQSKDLLAKHKQKMRLLPSPPAAATPIFSTPVKGAPPSSSSSSYRSSGVTSSSSSDNGYLNFRADLLQWRPPPVATSSPSVSFPPEDAPTSSRKPTSHAKKRIRY